MKTMRRIRNPKYVSVNGVATTIGFSVVLLTPAVAASQSPQTGAVLVRQRAEAPAQFAMNACMRLKESDPQLASTPEGLEMLKMMRELDMAGNRMIRIQKADSASAEFKRVKEVRSEVDSMARIMFKSTDGTNNTFIFQLAPGSVGAGPIGASSANGVAAVSGMLVGDGPRQIFMQGDRLQGDLSQFEKQRLERRLAEMMPRVGDAVRVTINVRSTASGYLGVTTSTSTFPSILDVTRPFGYCDYPRVETVDAGSPADKVGLTSGDTLIAFNNRDLLKYDVTYESLLQPGKQLQIKFRRDGQVHEVAPIIAPRGEEVFMPARQRCADPEMRAQCEAAVEVQGFPVALTGLRPQGQVAPSRSSPFNPILAAGIEGEALLGGAKIQLITEDFAKTSGGTAGWMVMNVREGMPAERATIHFGETIVEVNGKRVSDLMSLNRAIYSRMSERVATIKLSSKAGVRSVTMRW